MPIPGMTPDLVLKGKVRTGETRTSKTSGKTYPAATDYFLCDDPDFHKAAGEKPSTIQIKLAYDDVTEAWSSGLEWWLKEKGQNKLACYTKGETNSVGLAIAHRVERYKDDDDKVLGEKHGDNRLPILCRVRECPHMGKDCKPMGRLTFYVYAAGEYLGPYRMDTKSWNSVENFEKVLAPLVGKTQKGKAVSDRMFELSVAFQTSGDNRFPVMTLTEVGLDVNTETDVTAADALVTLMNNRTREGLAAYLDAESPGWKDNPAIVEKLQEVGWETAIDNIIRKNR